MNLTSLIVMGLVAIAGLFFAVIKPLFLAPQSEYVPTKVNNNYEQEAEDDVIMKMMADLKLDYDAEKITEEQFNETMLELKKSLVAAKKKYSAKKS